MFEWLRHILLHKEQTEKNTSDLKQVKQDVIDVGAVMQRFDLRLTHLQDTEVLEREKMALRLENFLLRERSLPSGNALTSSGAEELRRELEELKRENEELRRRLEQREIEETK